jgi:hypothetical protein
MTWHAAEMPDDALDPTSLVGRMLNPEAVPPELVAEAEEFLEEYADDFKALAASERAELPLWRVMDNAFRDDPGSDAPMHSIHREGYAAEIEALRDWLPRRPPKEFYDQLCAELQIYDVTMVGRTMDWLHELLTEQARIARDGS